jgi:hypothetical protein
MGFAQSVTLSEEKFEMMKFIIVVRELDSFELDYSLEFEAPSIPEVGSYISINRLDQRKPLGEDLIVRKVWWRLHHPETRAIVDEAHVIGKVEEIFVECDQALWPYSSAQWRKRLEAAQDRGVQIEEFQVSRMPMSSEIVEE